MKMSAKLLMISIVLFSIVMTLGCAGREFAPKDPYMYWYYPKELPEADRAVDDARKAGKDQKCPEDFNAVRDMKEKAYEVYAECRDNEAIATAKEATAKAKALCPLEDVHFDFNKATLTEHARKILRKDIRILKGKAKIKVSIDGHACQHGSEHYNLRLSRKRANAVREFLVKGGISPRRLSIIAYGKTRPLFAEEPTPRNKNSKEMKANRRVHFETTME